MHVRCEDWEPRWFCVVPGPVRALMRASRSQRPLLRYTSRRWPCARSLPCRSDDALQGGSENSALGQAHPVAFLKTGEIIQAWHLSAGRLRVKSLCVQAAEVSEGWIRQGCPIRRRNGIWQRGQFYTKLESLVTHK